MEDEFKQSGEDIRKVYNDLKKIVEMNQDIWIMPVALYNRIVQKIEYLDSKLKDQTESLKRHLKEKQELRRELKKWKK